MPVHIKYKNWKGVVSFRIIIPNRIYFGVTEYHLEPQWLLEAFDFDKKEARTFAMKDIQEWVIIKL